MHKTFFFQLSNFDRIYCCHFAAFNLRPRLARLATFTRYCDKFLLSFFSLSLQEEKFRPEVGKRKRKISSQHTPKKCWKKMRTRAPINGDASSSGSASSPSKKAFWAFACGDCLSLSPYASSVEVVRR